MPETKPKAPPLEPHHQSEPYLLQVSSLNVWGLFVLSVLGCWLLRVRGELGVEGPHPEQQVRCGANPGSNRHLRGSPIPARSDPRVQSGVSPEHCRCGPQETNKPPTPQQLVRM